MLSYQKIKNRIDELEERVRYELSLRKKKPTQAEMPSPGSHKVFFQKLKLLRLKLLFLSLRLLFWELTLNLVQFFILIFGDTANSFDILFKQKSLTVCNYSYSQFKKLQQRVKVFSVAGITTIIAVTVITSLLINLATGPVMHIFAAQYDFIQQSWSGGASGTAATHTDNKTGWTYYASKDAGVAAGDNLTVTASSDSFEESASGFDSNTSADSSLSVSANSVALLKPNTAACSVAAECESGTCSGGVCAIAKILVYVTTSSYNGNLGGRSGADAKCALVAPAGAQNIHAMVSFSNTDEVWDMWSNYGYDTNWPIYWYNLSNSTETLMANDRADILDGTIVNSQQTGTGNSNNVWTGTNGVGRWASWPNTSQCGGFTSTACLAYDGYGTCITYDKSVYGNSTSSSSNDNWIYLADSSCTTSMPIRCMFTQ